MGYVLPLAWGLSQTFSSTVLRSARCSGFYTAMRSSVHWYGLINNQKGVHYPATRVYDLLLVKMYVLCQSYQRVDASKRTSSSEEALSSSKNPPPTEYPEFYSRSWPTFLATNSNFPSKFAPLIMQLLIIGQTAALHHKCSFYRTSIAPLPHVSLK